MLYQKVRFEEKNGILRYEAGRVVENVGPNSWKVEIDEIGVQHTFLDESQYFLRQSPKSSKHCKNVFSSDDIESAILNFKKAESSLIPSYYYAKKRMSILKVSDLLCVHTDQLRWLAYKPKDYSTSKKGSCKPMASRHVAALVPSSRLGMFCGPATKDSEKYMSFHKSKWIKVLSIAQSNSENAAKYFTERVIKKPRLMSGQKMLGSQLSTYTVDSEFSRAAMKISYFLKESVGTAAKHGSGEMLGVTRKQANALIHFAMDATWFDRESAEEKLAVSGIIEKAQTQELLEEAQKAWALMCKHTVGSDLQNMHPPDLSKVLSSEEFSREKHHKLDGLFIKGKGEDSEIGTASHGQSCTVVIPGFLSGERGTVTKAWLLGEKHGWWADT